MRKRLTAVLLAAWLCICLSGCSFSLLDTKNLMAPPKANADQQAIHKLLQGTEPDVTFVYPKSGEFRSAIIMRDFTGDGVEDAIGFCTLEDGGGVEVQFLEKTEGQWHMVTAFHNTAIQVDRVCFGDLTGNGTEDVLIGWGSAAGTTGRIAAVDSYHYDKESDSMEEYPLGTYGEMAVTDLDRDGVKEVFTVDNFLPAAEEGDEPSPAKAKVYAWREGAMAEVCSADADNSISSYVSALYGQLSPTLWGVALDGAKADGAMTTQIFYLEEERLVNAPAGVNTEEYANPFTRPSLSAFQCRDINGDGSVEIPSVTLLSNLPEGVVPDGTSYLVTWNAFRRYGSLNVMRAMMNPGENYWFRLPYWLAGKITASNDASKRTVLYSQVMAPDEDGVQLLGPPLFSIRAFTQSSWDTWGQSRGYEQLAVQNDTVYGIQVMTEDRQMLQYIKEIRRSFKLLSE